MWDAECAAARRLFCLSLIPSPPTRQRPPVVQSDTPRTMTVTSPVASCYNAAEYRNELVDRLKHVSVNETLLTVTVIRPDILRQDSDNDPPVGRMGSDGLL